ncbi:unnamed protein product [Arabis nemorensis]|uniref:Uncharacterized protein n=1 Tax=Arabis nemorensis TaxID=586526 RepID=A0A565CPS0_9BRAS|nr:unnamed protein product [Arabis nemorensis]
MSEEPTVVDALLHEASPAPVVSKQSVSLDTAGASKSRKTKTKSTVSVSQSKPVTLRTGPRRLRPMLPKKKFIDLTPHLLDSEGSDASPPQSLTKHVTGDVRMNNAPVFASGVTDDGPPAFLLHYAENRRLVLEKDKKYPEIKKSNRTSAPPLTFQLDKKSSSLYGIPIPVKTESLEDDLQQLSRLLNNKQVEAVCSRVGQDFRSRCDYLTRSMMEKVKVFYKDHATVQRTIGGCPGTAAEVLLTEYNFCKGSSFCRKNKQRTQRVFTLVSEQKGN